MKKLLAVGTLPPPIGGTSISFQGFIDMANEHPSVSLSILDSRGLRGADGKLKITKFISFISKLKSCIKSSDVVMLHLSYQALTLLAPFAILLCKTFKKKLVIRRFGGVLHNEMSFFHRVSLNFALKHSDIYLVETKRQVKELKNKKVVFYPTGRSKKFFSLYNSPPSKLTKVSFISQVKKTKGIFELIEAVGNRPDLKLEIYGPLYDGIKKQDLERYENIKYLGVVSGISVNEVICDTDAICLPSYYPGEGYPGIIFEAIQCGKPVLVSNWKGLPDLVYKNSGVIVEPKSDTAIIEGLNEIEKIIESEEFIPDIEKLSAEFDSDSIFNDFINRL